MKVATKNLYSQQEINKLAYSNKISNTKKKFCLRILSLLFFFKIPIFSIILSLIAIKKENHENVLPIIGLILSTFVIIFYLYISFT